MRPQLLSLGFALATAASVFAQVSYDGAQAVRVVTGDDVIPLMEIIDKLGLASWKGVAPDGTPRANANVDLVVPAEKVVEFTDLVDGMEFEVLHEDLGASISAEAGESKNKMFTSKQSTWRIPILVRKNNN